MEITLEIVILVLIILVLLGIIYSIKKDIDDLEYNLSAASKRYQDLLNSKMHVINQANLIRKKHVVLINCQEKIIKDLEKKILSDLKNNKSK